LDPPLGVRLSVGGEGPPGVGVATNSRQILDSKYTLP